MIDGRRDTLSLRAASLNLQRMARKLGPKMLPFCYFDRKFNRLVEYAHDTGGDVYFGVKSGTFGEFFSRISEEARNQYTLSFEPRGERKKVALP